MRRLTLLSAGLFLAAAGVALADDPPPAPVKPQAQAAGRRAGGDPAARAQSTREFLGLGVAPDAAAAARGGPVFQQQCAACHGAEARGGIGPSLIHSSLVLDDDHGEKLVPFLKVGRPEKGMPPFATLGDAQLKDIAEFIHLQVENVANRGTYENNNNILVGDKKRGAAFVKKNCLTCHSLTGDLKGVGAKWRPLDLQKNWVFPPREGDKRQFRATVTTAGATYSGKIQSIDDFRVVLLDDKGVVRPIARGKGVEVKMIDPLQPHRELARTLKDRDMTDVTTYLETLK